VPGDIAGGAREVRQEPHPPEVILGDTMGELRKFYALASVVFVGRSLVDLGPKQHGSDMIEPAALGKPVIVGPYTGNFEEPMRAFRSADAVVEVRDGDELRKAVEGLLADPARVADLGRRAREVVAAGRGSAARHVDALERLLRSPLPPREG